MTESFVGSINDFCTRHGKAPLTITELLRGAAAATIRTPAQRRALHAEHASNFRERVKELQAEGADPRYVAAATAAAEYCEAVSAGSADEKRTRAAAIAAIASAARVAAEEGKL